MTELNSIESVSVQNIVVKLLEQIEENKDLTKSNKEMIDDYLSGFEEYRESRKAFDSAKTQLRVDEGKVMLMPQGQSLADKKAELREERRDLNQSLSGYLETMILSGNDEINVNGKTIKIKVKCQVNAGQLPLFG